MRLHVKEKNNFLKIQLTRLHVKVFFDFKKIVDVQNKTGRLYNASFFRDWKK
jgi:hypothetical protein